ncbi:MAG: hypothetical protein JKY37_18590 [Nannocystaceae bacterium]|nr:hypothetical protein [Nannocystaceae bacterium]
MRSSVLFACGLVFCATSSPGCGDDSGGDDSGGATGSGSSTSGGSTSTPGATVVTTVGGEDTAATSASVDDSTTGNADGSDSGTAGGTSGDSTGADLDTTGADSGSGSSESTGGGGAVAAVPGERCAPNERVALVQISGGGLLPYLRVTFNDTPPPFIGAPALSTASCEFYEFLPAWPCGCGVDEVCSWDDECVAEPQPVAEFDLVVSAGGREQLFTETDTDGQITVGDDAFALELSALGVTVTLPETAIPGGLLDLEGNLSGTFEAPTAVDLSWSPTADGTHVLSLTNINHHAPQPTFTTCTVAGADGSLHIDGDMLVPLSVITGLEFQAIEHARVAAAQTDIGCIEFVFAVQTYVPIG